MWIRLWSIELCEIDNQASEKVVLEHRARNRNTGGKGEALSHAECYMEN